MKRWKIVLPTLLTTSGLPLVSLVGCGTKIAKFSTDSWTTVLDYIENGGIQRLCKEYRCSKNDFIGRTRTVIINNLEHEVKVIGVQQDFLDQDHTQPITLTFQFNNVICDESGNALSHEWGHDTPEQVNYWNSGLCGYLESDVYGFINNQEENEGLAEKIKDTYHTVNAYIDGAWTPISDSAKIFSPTLANLFCKDVLDDLYKNEGEQYQFYAEKIGNGKVQNQYECLDIRDLKENWCPVWLASSDLRNCDLAKYTVQGFTLEEPKYASYCVAPCFCI